MFPFEKFKLLISYLFLLISLIGSNLVFAHDLLSFQIEYVNQKSTSLKVISTFIGTQTTRSLIHLPPEGIKNLMATADNIPTKIIENPDDPSHQSVYVLHARPQALIKINYSISQVFPDPPTAAALRHVLINNDYFYFVGYQAFIWPDHYKKDIALTLAWKMPGVSKLYNSFGIEQKEQHANVNDIDDLTESLFVGGDFRLIKSPQKVNQQNYYTVIRGKWPFTDLEYAEELNSAFAAVNQFWPSSHPSIFLNALLPVNPLKKDKTSTISTAKIEIGGSELYNAFVLMATVPATVDKEIWERIHSIAAHEYNHHWIPSRLVEMKESDLGGRWFSEGINEYLAQKLRLLSQDISFEKYIEHCNKVVANYFTSPVFGENIDMGEYPPLGKETVYFIMHSYYRGELLAWRWELDSCKKEPVEQVLLQMLRDASDKLPIFSDELVAKYFKQVCVYNVLEDIKKFGRHGDEIPLTGRELGPKVGAKKVAMVRYDIGFNLQKSKQQKKIMGLEIDGPAAKAGLKEGDAFVDLNYDYGNTNVPVKIRLKNDELLQEKTITYSPSKPIQVLQYFFIQK